MLCCGVEQRHRGVKYMYMYVENPVATRVRTGKVVERLMYRYLDIFFKLIFCNNSHGSKMSKKMCIPTVY